MILLEKPNIIMKEYSYYNFWLIIAKKYVAYIYFVMKIGGGGRLWVSCRLTGLRAVVLTGQGAWEQGIGGCVAQPGMGGCSPGPSHTGRRAGVQTATSSWP